MIARREFGTNNSFPNLGTMAFAWSDLGKQRNTTVRIVNALCEIRKEHSPTFRRQKHLKYLKYVQWRILVNIVSVLLPVKCQHSDSRNSIPCLVTPSTFPCDPLIQIMTQMNEELNEEGINK
jgi:hypothetical protein